MRYLQINGPEKFFLNRIVHFIILIGFAFLGGYCAGLRHIKEERTTKTISEQTEKQSQIKKNVERIIQKPDGTIIREKKEIKEDVVKKKDKKENQTTIVYKPKKPKWKIEYLGLYRIDSNRFAQGIKIDRRIGESPFTIGVWGIERIGIGISIGMEW